MNESLPRSLKLGWGVGALGTSTLLYVNAFLLLYFLTSELGIAPAVAGTLIFASKLYDAITDPVMGMLSDRSSTSWGRRRPFMLAGAVICGISGVLLFNVPDLGGSNAVLVYVGAVLLIYATGYTLFNVPYLAMPAEMTRSYDERTNLMSYRVAFVALGGIVGTALAPMIVAGAGGGSEGYGTMGWILGSIIGVAMLASVAGTRRATFTNREVRDYSLRERAKLVLGNRPFCLLMAAKFLQLIGLASVLSSLPFFVLQVMRQSETFLGLFGIALNVFTIVAMPFWVGLSRRVGKKYSYIASVVAYSLVLLTWLAAGPEESTQVFLLRAALIGLTSGGILLMGTALLPDTIEYDFHRTGLRREGIFSGVYSFIEKTAFALAPLAVGIVLTLTGYVESVGENIAQSERALDGIYISFVAIPVTAALLSTGFLAAYRLSAQDLQSPV